MRPPLAQLSLSALLIFAGCTPESRSSQDAARSEPNGLMIRAELINGEIIISAENRTTTPVTLSGESFVGYGSGDPRLSVVVLDENKRRLAPCVHLDPPLAQEPPLTIVPGAVVKKSVTVSLLRKVYCAAHGDIYIQGTSSVVSVKTISGPPLLVPATRQ